MDNEKQVRSGFKLNGISKREIQVLDCMAKGDSSKQIARDLCISEHTVISHRKNLLRKMKARNAANLIFKSVQHGFILI